MPKSQPKADLSTVADLDLRRRLLKDEDPNSFALFHAGLMADLAPKTAYERVCAANLIALEWQLLRHRRLRDAIAERSIRRCARKADAGGLLLRHLHRSGRPRSARAWRALRQNVEAEATEIQHQRRLIARYRAEAESARRTAFRHGCKRRSRPSKAISRNDANSSKKNI